MLVPLHKRARTLSSPYRFSKFSKQSLHRHCPGFSTLCRNFSNRNPAHGSKSKHTSSKPVARSESKSKKQTKREPTYKCSPSKRQDEDEVVTVGRGRAANKTVKARQW